MEFALTRNQKKWKKIAREFVEKHINPEVSRRDRIENAKDRIPWDWIREADKHGLRTLGISKKYGFTRSTGSLTLEYFIKILTSSDTESAVAL